MIVTIDGPAGSGKSSVAQKLADRIGFRFLNTGSMYRAVAWASLTNGIPLSPKESNPSDEVKKSVVEVASNLSLELKDETLFVDGQDQSTALKSEDVSNLASIVAALEGVRHVLVDKQRQIASTGNFVTEGRDQGTIVFPNAECKFFLTASPEERAKRRFTELKLRGETAQLEDVLKDIKHRDHRDETRTTAPLKPATDAEVIDTTKYGYSEVLNLLEQKAKSKLNLPI